MIQISKFYLLIMLTACSHKGKTKENINNKKHIPSNMNLLIQYEPSVCAPKFYPVEVYRGDFYTEDDWVSIPNGGIVEGNWGDNSKNMGEGSIIPTGFTITYFSYLENKFYKGDFKLPYELIKKMFTEGMISYPSMKKVSFHTMIVGMAPGGMLVVWMKGDTKQVEIDKYQATETTIDWELFKPNTGFSRDEFLRRTIDHRTEAVDNFDKNGLMLGLWDSYRIKYNWRPKFEFPEGCKVEGIDLKMYNGETYFLWGDELEKNAFELRAITKRSELLWADETGQKYGADIYFDEAEVFEAYKLIYKENKDQNAELIIKYNDTRTSLEIYLRSKSEEIELEKCKVKMFKRSR
jgi:hypothetical protein